MRLKRLALRILLVCIAIAAILGIAGILGGGLHRTSVNCLATALAIGGSSLVSLACLAGWELPAAVISSRLGVAAAWLTTILMLLLIWKDPHSESFERLTATVVVVAIAAAHATILQLARLPPQFQIVRTIAIAINLMIVLAVMAAIWEQVHGEQGEEILAVLAIVESALTLAVIAIAAAHRTVPAEGGVAEVCYCPRCGKSLWVPAGEVRCRHCNESYVVELRKVDELPVAVLNR